MSKNSSNQIEIEQKCITRIKQMLKVENCFGLSVHDYQNLKNWLDEIIANSKSNNFPDFLIKRGFVEHFTVTSAEENKKGATHKIADKKFREKNKISAQKLSDQNGKYSNTLEYENHSHSNLITSLKRNWESHINSLGRYEGDKEHSIFLVEYSELLALSMAENKFKGISEGLSIGDYPEQEIFHSYRLSRDRIVLNWLYQYKNEIEYIIFTGENLLEIIKLENIKELLEVLPYEFVVCPNVTIELDEGYYLGSFEYGNDENKF